MERDLEPADVGYVPCGVEQIAQDEARLRQVPDSGLGASWGLRALGHHLQSSPERYSFNQGRTSSKPSIEFDANAHPHQCSP